MRVWTFAFGAGNWRKASDCGNDVPRSYLLLFSADSLSDLITTMQDRRGFLFPYFYRTRYEVIYLLKMFLGKKRRGWLLHRMYVLIPCVCNIDIAADYAPIDVMSIKLFAQSSQKLGICMYIEKTLYTVFKSYIYTVALWIKSPSGGKIQMRKGVCLRTTTRSRASMAHIHPRWHIWITKSERATAFSVYRRIRYSSFGLLSLSSRSAFMCTYCGARARGESSASLLTGCCGGGFFLVFDEVLKKFSLSSGEKFFQPLHAHTYTTPRFFFFQGKWTFSLWIFYKWSLIYGYLRFSVL